MTARTVGTIFIHDLTALWRDGRLRIAFAVTLILLAVATVSGAYYQSALTSERTAADEAERTRWLSQGAKNPHSAAHYGVYVFKPASPLTLFDRGIEPFVGVGVWLEAHKMNSFVYRPAQDASTTARFGDLSAATLLQTIVPLLIILAGYAALSGERERGTLRQLLISGSALRYIGAGKLAAAVAAVVLALLPAALLAGAAAAAGPTGIDGGRLGLLVLGYARYLAGWAALTLAVSARAGTARTGLIALLGVWLFVCVLGPRAAADVAVRLHPVPTATAFANALEADLDPAHSTERTAQVRERILKEHGVATTAELPFDFGGISLQESEEHGNEVFDKHFGALFDTYERQNRWLQTAGIAVPQLAIRAVSQSAAGTDYPHHRRFVTAAEDHRRMMQRMLNGDLAKQNREGMEYKASAELWSQIPHFAFMHAPLGTILRDSWTALAALVLWFAGTALFFGVSMRRIRP